jgi:pyruvate/2-oxoglutarate dehydrogenase complex dihydrolipoamide acyltransferase (E2) component
MVRFLSKGRLRRLVSEAAICLANHAETGRGEGQRIMQKVTQKVKQKVKQKVEQKVKQEVEKAAHLARNIAQTLSHRSKASVPVRKVDPASFPFTAYKWP